HTRQVVVGVGRLIHVVVGLDAAVDVQLEGDLGVVLPVGVAGVGGAADDEAPGRLPAGLHARRHAGAGVVAEVVAHHLLDRGLVELGILLLGLVLLIAVLPGLVGGALAGLDHGLQFLDLLLLGLQLGLQLRLVRPAYPGGQEQAGAGAGQVLAQAAQPVT